MSLAAQFEHFFESIAIQLEGYDEMKKHGLVFKHAWMDWEKRLSKPENQLKVLSPPDSTRINGRFLLRMWLD
jgi:hypothetical protein